ncbi:hypothetical protein BCO18175_01812 [Burkholderia contaminans]|uniref:hypothetical protein n=1 Tax=Burkholderia contaminans TaxID=488447 RepID=UPI001452E87D|nr:hypothetical protein [Burkholderia contaminans]VWC68627.1 hypothetical protein BCO18175_01812 [Burkholderia contaminans]
MIRYFLAKGDQGGSATITEGLEGVTCSNPPPRVHIATLYMKTYCTACKQEGFVAPDGPRWPGTGPNGKPWALSGDINVCDCKPPPVFYAERGMKMTFAADEVARLTGKHGLGVAPIRRGAAVHDQQFVIRNKKSRKPVVGVRYWITNCRGDVLASGITDAQGHTVRVITPDAESVKLEVIGETE